MVTPYLERVAQYLRESDLEEVEHWIESLPLGKEQRAVLWLFARDLRDE